MSTDGHVPSVASDEHPEREPDADLEPDRSPVQLRRELRLRVQGPAGPEQPVPPADHDHDHDGEPPGPPAPLPNGRPVLSTGRHARRDNEVRPPRLDYVPRHAVRTPGPGSAAPVSPTDKTEVFSRVRRDPTEPSRSARPGSAPLVAPRITPAPERTPPAPEPEPEPVAPRKRERVVLAQRKGQARPVRTVVDVQEGTQVGEVLSSSLIGSQLGLSLRIGGIALLALGALPALFAVFPTLGRFELFGLRVPWLLLGVLAYPFLLLLGWVYTRSADKIEQVFADHVQS